MCQLSCVNSCRNLGQWYTVFLESSYGSTKRITAMKALAFGLGFIAMFAVICSCVFAKLQFMVCQYRALEFVL